MKRVTDIEYDALHDHAEAVTREAYAKLVGHDAEATLLVIGSLIASVEDHLGWSRERLLERVSEIADDCSPEVNN